MNFIRFGEDIYELMLILCVNIFRKLHIYNMSKVQLKKCCLEEFRPRIEKMLKMSEKCGCGFPDTLYDFCYEFQ